MRRLLLLLFASIIIAGTAHAQVVPGQAKPQVDKYGCLLNVSTTAKGFWYFHKFSNKWLFVDPEGNACFVTGVEGVTTNIGGSATYQTVAANKYGDAGKPTWAPQMIRRLRTWGMSSSFGFNATSEAAQPTATSGSWPDGIQPEKFPTILDIDPIGYTTGFNSSLDYCSPGQHDKYVSSSVNSSYATTRLAFDPYDPCYQVWLSALMVDNTAGGFAMPTQVANPFVIGIMLGEGDNIKCLADNATCASETLAESPLMAIDTKGQPSVTRTTSAKAALVTFLQGRYAGIAALNTAWGSSYSSFGTSGTHRTDNCGTGNGSNLGPFTCTLSFTPDAMSVQVTVAGTLVAGENTSNAQVLTPAPFSGATVSAGSVNHTTKAVTITFTGGNAPGNGAAVVVDYYSGGWGVGSGLLDENGNTGAHAWMPTDDNLLTGVTTAMAADLYAFQTAFVGTFASTARNTVKGTYPNFLYFGPNLAITGACFPEVVPPYPWGVQSIAGYGPYVDALVTEIAHCISPAGFQAALDNLVGALGDVPIIDSLYIGANTDSTIAPGTVEDPLDFRFGTTQKDKGAIYTTITNELYTATSSAAVANSKPIVGFRLWANLDNSSENINWGIVSMYDNAYDGISTRSLGCTVAHPETCRSGCLDAWGWPCGAEAQTARTFNLGTGTGSQTSFTGTPSPGYLSILPGSFTVTAGTTNIQQATDAFQRADSNPLSNGAQCTWTNLGSFSPLQIVSHNVEGTATGNGNGEYCSGPSWTAGQYAEVTVGTVSADGVQGVSAAVRMIGTDAYMCRAGGPLGSSATLSIRRYQAGTLTSGTFTVSAADVIHCEAFGNSIVLTQNGTPRLSVNDSNLASGVPGIIIDATQGAPSAATVTNFTAGNTTSAPGCTETGTGVLVAGGTCTGGTIQYLSPGSITATFSPAPANGIPVSTAYMQDGWGGLQPAFVPAAMAENFKVLHSFENNFFSPASYTNLARYKPTSASSFLLLAGSGGNNYITPRVNDGDTATTWQAVASDPQWVRVDLLGAPSVSKVILRWGGVYATHYTLDWSNDGISWTTAFTQASGAGGVETDTFSAASHRYWRMNETARSGGGSLVLQEFELYAQ